jgi:Xaa-Pro dipeptidase
VFEFMRQPRTIATLPAPPAPDVDPSELDTRLAAVRTEMARDSIDFLVLTDQKNVDYFTDFRSLNWGYHSRPMFAVIDADDIRVVANKTESRNVESKVRNFSVVYYEGYMPEGAQALIATISAQDPAVRCTTAVDYGQDMYGRGSLEIIDGLRRRGPGARLTSGAGALWRTRMVKSPFEAELKRTSFAIVNAAFDEAVAEARLGITEVELCRQIQARIVMKGAERADPIPLVFCRGDFNYSQPARMEPLRAGQYVWTDFRSTYGGYPADRNRIARGGVPERWEVDAYEKTRALTISLGRGVRAGMSCGDVFRAFERLWNDAGLPSVYGLVSRIGHGGGLDVTEPPSISRDNPEIITPGMILHLEPKLEIDGLVFQFEEVVYVREDGVEFLSELSPERIPIIN